MSGSSNIIRASQQFAKAGSSDVSIVKELLIGLSLGLAAGSVWKVRLCFQIQALC